MFRKLIVVAAAVAMPLSMVTLTGLAGTGGIAGAKAPPPPPDPAVSCHITSTVTFAAPGLSLNGDITTAKTSTTTSTGTSIVAGPGCSGAGGNPLTIVSKNSKCAKTPNSPVPGCVKGSTYFDSFSGFAGSSTTASLAKAVKHLTFVVNGITYAAKGTGTSEIYPTSLGGSGLCGSEVGFGITGVVKAPKQDKVQTVAVQACLGHVTGSNLADPNNFLNDLASNNPAEVIATATVDPSNSTLHIG